MGTIPEELDDLEPKQSTLSDFGQKIVDMVINEFADLIVNGVKNLTQSNSYEHRKFHKRKRRRRRKKIVNAINQIEYTKQSTSPCNNDVKNVVKVVLLIRPYDHTWTNPVPPDKNRLAIRAGLTKPEGSFS